jgi:hypothetical protein
MEQPLQPSRVIGAGRGALILAMAGAGWLGWGLSVAQVYNAVVAPIFGTVAISLWGWSIYVMRTGRALHRQLPASSLPLSQFPTRSFVVVLVTEGLAVVLVILFAAGHAHRPDLATDGCALVIGLHYIPLARIFRAPKLAALGILIALWCILSWVFFRTSTLVVAVTAGTGILMWATAVAVLLWARSAARMLRANPSVLRAANANEAIVDSPCI